ncbi:unnamed protein product [Sphenostylis stenocarpa]|uniref:MADS-box domain-containing protein n=1 Tax=Sphenostylis stenocarpa TaxID=92480 RepID=A0AA86SQ15_9FABA|nr:unnamed protein product [Sphenostylis stenocarpa]
MGKALQNNIFRTSFLFHSCFFLLTVMARKKVDLTFITKASKRKATFKKRKNGLIKKIGEISILCGIQACAIIYTPDEPDQPEVWPSEEGVESAVSRFRSVSELEQSKKMFCQESFLRQRIVKVQEQLKKARNENRKKEIGHLISQYLTVGNNLESTNLIDLNDISFLADQCLEDITKKITVRKAQMLIPENGGETVTQGAQAQVNHVQGPYTSVDAMQTLNWSTDIINGDGANEMLALEDVNVQSVMEDLSDEMNRDSRLQLFPHRTRRTLGLVLPHPFLHASITSTPLSLSQRTLTNNLLKKFFAAKPRSLVLHSHFLHNNKWKKQPLIMGMKGASDDDHVVLKSPNDRRLYRLLHLPNGLRALLVHDPEIYPEGPPKHAPNEDEVEEEEEEEDEDDGEGEEEYDDDDEEEEADDEGDGEKDGVKGGGGATAQSKRMGSGFCVEMWGLGNGYAICDLAAAAMCVGMGSFSDPNQAQGLAHFLEHMLFMGSDEFPDENELCKQSGILSLNATLTQGGLSSKYDSYLSKHGGSSNAYTETEYTCYHFEVKREFLKGALKRFSQFFISPLVKMEAMEREVLAVDSEFNQVLQSDACRLQQLQCHTSAHNHPLNRFFWGNKKSLVDAMVKGIDLREQILKLYGDYYHGGLMKLVVIGGESLDVLESWVVELFGAVKKGQANPVFSVEGPIWKTGKVYWLEAVKDVHILDLSWTLPCLHKEYLKKPEDYLAHLLGHEGRGSLLSFLKTKGWATSLSAGVGDEGIYRSSIAYVFVMSIHLTDSGIEKIFDIIGFVYQYLKLLRQDSPQEWIFKELQNIGNMDFRFVEEQPQDDYAAELAGS